MSSENSESDSVTHCDKTSSGEIPNYLKRTDPRDQIAAAQHFERCLQARGARIEVPTQHRCLWTFGALVRGPRHRG